MRNQGSEAYSLYGTSADRRREAALHAPFGVVEGDGLDARVRQGVSDAFWGRIKALVACALLVAAVGVGRVALSAATVSNLQATSGLRETIASVQSSNDDLKMERSVLSSSSRINSIATEVYGMVFPTTREVVDLSSDSTSTTEGSGDAQETDDAQASEDPQTSGAGSASSDGTSSDGDAAQAQGDAGSASTVA